MRKVVHCYGSGNTFASYICKLWVVIRNEFYGVQYAFYDRCVWVKTKSSFNFIPDTALHVIFVEREEGHEKLYQVMGQYKALVKWALVVCECDRLQNRLNFQSGYVMGTQTLKKNGRWTCERVLTEVISSINFRKNLYFPYLTKTWKPKYAQMPKKVTFSKSLHQFPTLFESRLKKIFLDLSLFVFRLLFVVSDFAIEWNSIHR